MPSLPGDRGELSVFDILAALLPSFVSGEKQMTGEGSENVLKILI